MDKALMKSLIALLMVLLIFPANGQILAPILATHTSSGGGGISGCSGAPTASGSSGCLVRETFEGSTLCYSGFTSNCNNAWYFAENSLQFNYTTSPAPLQGSYSAYFPDNGTFPDGMLAFTASATSYAGAIVNLNTYTANQAYGLIQTETSQGATLCQVVFNTFSPATLQVVNSGGTSQQITVTGGFTAGATYYVELEGVVGTGANATCTAKLSTNGTSWGYTVSSTNGTWTTNLDYVEIGQTGYTGINKIVDDIRVATSSFNYW